MNQSPPCRLWFINRFYWPDETATAQLLTDLAEGLAARGHRIMVIASHDGLPATPRQEVRREVGIIRIRATRWGRSGIIAKAIDYATFAVASRHVLRSRVRANDRIVAMTDPPALALVAASAACRRRAKLVHWLQDIHPEITLALSGSRVLAGVFKPWIRWRNSAWQQADACVAISSDMAALVVENGVPADRVPVIPNWAPGAETLAPVPPKKAFSAANGGWKGNSSPSTPATSDAFTLSNRCLPPQCCCETNPISCSFSSGPAPRGLPWRQRCARRDFRTCNSSRPSRANCSRRAFRSATSTL